MASSDADRSGITLRDHVDAVVGVIDHLDPADGGLVLVGHSAGCAIAHAAVDARPARVTRDPLRLSDERRYDVPVTVVVSEFPSALLREWVEQGQPGVRELATIREVTYVDLPTGHWPQLTRPAELARAILAAVGPT